MIGEVKIRWCIEVNLVLEATNFEPTDRYKILAQSASKKPKANVLRK